MNEYSESFQAHANSSHPLVSVVVTSYNKGPFLAECIESFVTQAYPHYEIVLVNDGSPDNTSDVVRNLQKKYPNVDLKLIEKENGGVSHARNVGFERIRGRIVMTIDGDDKIHPEYLLKALECFRKSDADIFKPSQQNFGGDDTQWNPLPYNEFNIRFDNCFPTPTLYDRKYYDLAGGFKNCLSYCEDWEFWVNCSRYKPVVESSDEYLTYWRRTEDGLYAKGVEGKIREALSSIIILNEDLYPITDILKSHEQCLRSPEEYFSTFERLKSIHPNEWFFKFLFGLRAEKNNDPDTAIELYSEALKLKPDGWQSYARLGNVCLKKEDYAHARIFYDQVRIVRPDMCVAVNDIINKIDENIV